MSKTLFASVRESNNQQVVYRVGVTADVQAQLDDLFEEQEKAFTKNITESVAFDGMYKPDAEEILYIEDAELVAHLNETLQANATTFPFLDVGNLAYTDIQFLFRESTVHAGRLLMQRFSKRQFLSNSGIALILQGRTYRKLTEPGFSLDDKVSGYVSQDRVYFRSFFQLRTMLTVQEHFKEATQSQVESFADKPQLKIENKALFIANTDQTSRRLIHGIEKSGVLEAVDTETISNLAKELDIELNSSGGRLVIPMNKASMKLALRFLEQSVYKGLLTEEVFVSNSKKKMA